MSTAPLVLAPPAMRASLPLYEIEQTLAAYCETAEVVTPEQEEEFLQEFAAMLLQAVEKRDRMGQFLAHLDTQIGLAEQEIKRLLERKEAYERVREKTEEYLVRVIQSLGKDAKDRWKKLEGKTITFSLRGKPLSVKLLDDSTVPMQYKVVNVSLRLPAEVWETFLDTLDLALRAELLDGARVEYTVSKTAVKAALEAEQPVPGATISERTYSLVRK